MRSAILALAAATVSGKVYFEENFDDDTWADRWTQSTAKDAGERGDWTRTAGREC